MNYRHSYHAGNFADVFKHAIVTLLIEALAAKDKPFFCLDTHAGAGRYDLQGTAARKTGEFEQGIARLWGQRAPRAELHGYLQAVRAINPDGTLRWYPGSPRIVKYLLRPEDRLVLCEQHPQEHAQLKREFAGDPQVAVHWRDGYLGLKAFLPPRERRGLVLIDPPYEAPDEFERLAQALVSAHGRWNSGVYAAWYPIKAPAAVARFHGAIERSGIRKVLAVELVLFPEDGAVRLNGCGMLLINPPWNLKVSLKALLFLLAKLLRQDSDARIRLDWLVTE